MFSKFIDFVVVLSAICRLRAGPRKLPFSLPLLALTFILYIVARFAEEVFTRPPLEAGLLGLADALLLISVAAVPLWLLKLGNRIPQTLTAITSAGIVVSVVDIFMLLLLSEIPFLPGRADTVMAFLTFPLVLWQLLINTTLIRVALSLPFAYGFILALIHLGMVVALGGAMPGILAG